jgi:hypothetical protein
MDYPVPMLHGIRSMVDMLLEPCEVLAINLRVIPDGQK